MSARLDKIGSDLAKARSKRDEWDRRVKELERKYREVENKHQLVYDSDARHFDRAEPSHHNIINQSHKICDCILNHDGNGYF